MMELAKKVISGYMAHCNGQCGNNCPYYPPPKCMDNLKNDSEVVLNRGRWLTCNYKDEDTSYIFLTTYQCSNCKHERREKTHYCPNCGVEMEEVECDDDER